MTLYLIAHVVRGEPAFDIAEQMIVEGYDEPWWIIPTSGHRAYPYWHLRLDLMDRTDGGFMWDLEYEGSLIMLPIPAPPEDHPDHYTTTIQSKADHEAATSLLGQLGLLKPKQPLTRRI